MTCCAEPLIALFGGASLISTIIGIANKDPLMFLSGLAALPLTILGYKYYKSAQNQKRA